MSDAVIFVIVFVGLFVARICAATLVFYLILPRGDRCPNCDAPTIRVESKGMNRVMPWFRTSWCMVCNWSGVLRHGPLSPEAAAKEVSHHP